MKEEVFNSTGFGEGTGDGALGIAFNVVETDPFRNTLLLQSDVHVSADVLP
jgi:hypothetical protein